MLESIEIWTFNPAYEPEKTTSRRNNASGEEGGKIRGRQGLERDKILT